MEAVVQETVQQPPSTPVSRRFIQTQGTPTVKTPKKGVGVDCGKGSTVSVFLRIRPPPTEDDDVDLETGLPTYSAIVPGPTGGLGSPLARLGPKKVSTAPSTPSTPNPNGGDTLLKPTIVRVIPPGTSSHSRTISRQVKDFIFSEVFPPGITQDHVYEATTLPLVEDLLHGKNALLFAYGMTNAGKTYTTLGVDKNPGILPRALRDIFEGVEAQAKAAGALPPRVTMSFLEIYNENVYDLLASKNEEDWAKAREVLKLQDRLGRIEPRNLSKHCITSVEQGLEVVHAASRNRKVASTRLNEDSSRSHSICSISIESSEETSAEGEMEPCLWIVDLAGSERSKRTNAVNTASAPRQKEANNINLSLTKLWRCLQIMRQNQAPGGGPKMVVPFRESKLTLLFMNHLSGVAGGKTVLIVNLNPQLSDFDESQHVLANSALAQEVTTVKDLTGVARQAGLINNKYGYDGRRLLRRISRGGGRRSLKKPKTPTSAERVPKTPGAIDTSTPLAANTHTHTPSTNRYSNKFNNSHSKFTHNNSEEEDTRLSGAESDSALVDARQGLVINAEDLEVRNERLKAKVRRLEREKSIAVADARAEAARDTAALVDSCERRRLHQVAAEAQARAELQTALQQVQQLQASLTKSAEDHKKIEMARAHQLEELEAEFENFLEENGLSHPEDLLVPTVPILQVQVAQLKGDLLLARQEAQHWAKQAQAAGILSPPAGVWGWGRSPSISSGTRASISTPNVVITSVNVSETALTENVSPGRAQILRATPPIPISPTSTSITTTTVSVKATVVQGKEASPPPPPPRPANARFAAAAASVVAWNKEKGQHNNASGSITSPPSLHTTADVASKPAVRASPKDTANSKDSTDSPNAKNSIITNTPGAKLKLREVPPPPYPGTVRMNRQSSVASTTASKQVHVVAISRRVSSTRDRGKRSGSGSTGNTHNSRHNSNDRASAANNVAPGRVKAMARAVEKDATFFGKVRHMVLKMTLHDAKKNLQDKAHEPSPRVKIIRLPTRMSNTSPPSPGDCGLFSDASDDPDTGIIAPEGRAEVILSPLRNFSPLRGAQENFSKLRKRSASPPHS